MTRSPAVSDFYGSLLILEYSGKVTYKSGPRTVLSWAEKLSALALCIKPIINLIQTVSSGGWLASFGHKYYNSMVLFLPT